MWLGLLARFWKPLAIAALLIGAGLYLHHRWYEAGYAASEASWKLRFAQAEHERDAANRVARQKEADSIRLSQTAEAEHEKSVASLNLRAADADRRIRALSVRLAARTCRVEMPPASGAAPEPDAAPTSTEGADRVGGELTDLARRCELDAASKVEWQSFYTELRRTINRAD